MIRLFTIAALSALVLSAPITAQTNSDNVNTGNQQPTGATTPAKEPQKIVDLRIGVRLHARPFSYRTGVTSNDLTGKSGPLRSQGFDGYMVAVCDAVLKQMLIASDASGIPGALNIKPVIIEEVMKNRPLGTGEKNKHERVVIPDGDAVGAEITVRTRLDLLGPKIDILCDPATLTRDRVKRFAVSPPLFLTGIGYLTREGYVQPGNICRDGGAFIGLVGGTTANSYGLNEIIKAGEWRRVKQQVVKELRGVNGCTGTELADNVPLTGEEKNDEIKPKQLVIREYASHDAAANAFCNGDIDIYVGDVEIIQEHTRTIYGCDTKRGVKTFTEDRYAIYAKYDYTDVNKALWIGRFFDILNREIYGGDSVVNQAYSATFERDSESRKLQLFFWGLSGSRY